MKIKTGFLLLIASLSQGAIADESSEKIISILIDGDEIKQVSELDSEKLDQQDKEKRPSRKEARQQANASEHDRAKSILLSRRNRDNIPPEAQREIDRKLQVLEENRIYNESQQLDSYPEIREMLTKPDAHGVVLPKELQPKYGETTDDYINRISNSENAVENLKLISEKLEASQSSF
jgi:hypothetical protein